MAYSSNIMTFIDTHAHLNFKAFKEDYKDAIKRAFQADVKGIINVGSNLETSQKAIEIAHEYNNANIYAAVSLHPIHVKDEEFEYDKYLEMAKDNKVVALGETGLDYYRISQKSNIKKQNDNSKTKISDQDKKLQKEILIKFIDIANKIDKPIILHCRGAQDNPYFAYNELLKILKDYSLKLSASPGGVCHCFSGTLEQAEQFIQLGFYIGFTGIVTYPNAKNIEQIAKSIPLEKILIETDSPYLAPQKYRGTRNEPAYVIEVAKKIAQIKNISLEQVAKQTTQNAQKLFNLDF